MCGRYVIISEIKEIEKRFGVFAPQPELFQKNVNVSAGERAPVISSANPGELSFYHFGFSPAWSEKRMYLLNARSEGDANADNDPAYTGGLGIIQKPAFRKAIRSQRCLVVADAFLEGPEKEKLSKPYCVYKKDGERPFAFAGIWEEWLNKATGELLPTFAIITAPAISGQGALELPRVFNEVCEVNRKAKGRRDIVFNDGRADSVLGTRFGFPSNAGGVWRRIETGDPSCL